MEVYFKLCLFHTDLTDYFIAKLYKLVQNDERHKVFFFVIKLYAFFIFGFYDLQKCKQFYAIIQKNIKS